MILLALCIIVTLFITITNIKIFKMREKIKTNEDILNEFVKYYINKRRK